MDNIIEFVGRVRKKGVNLWSENGRLHYKAPKGAMTPEEVEVLKSSGVEIISFLEGTSTTEQVILTREKHGSVYYAPLTFSQLAHWHLYKLGERPSFCPVLSVTRLHGRLNAQTFQNILTRVVLRHETLRTRIIVRDGNPMQEIAEAGDCRLALEDLTFLSKKSRDGEVARRVEQIVHEPIWVTSRALLGVQLLKLQDDEHVLIVTMEHIISDGFSMNILLNEIFTAYKLAVNECAVSLPPISMQFSDYAVWQRRAQAKWLERNGAYWAECQRKYERLNFPRDKVGLDAARVGWGVVPMEIDKALTSELREWCRLRRTTLVMGVFTAYIGFVLRWCDVRSTIVSFETDGRGDAKIENTIGYFASALYVCAETFEGDTFVDLLYRVIDEYCEAYKHADSSYLEAQVPRPGFTRNTLFNWVPRTPDIVSLEQDQSKAAITWRRYPTELLVLSNLERDTEPIAAFIETEEEIQGTIQFSLNQFSVGEMERLTRNFLLFLRAMLARPPVRLAKVDLT